MTFSVVCCAHDVHFCHMSISLTLSCLLVRSQLPVLLYFFHHHQRRSRRLSIGSAIVYAMPSRRSLGIGVYRC